MQRLTSCKPLIKVKSGYDSLDNHFDWIDVSSTSAKPFHYPSPGFSQPSVNLLIHHHLAGGFHFYDHSWVSGPRHPTAPTQCRCRRRSDAACQVYQKHGFALHLRLSDRVHVHLLPLFKVFPHTWQRKMFSLRVPMVYRSILFRNLRVKQTIFTRRDGRCR